MSCLSYQHVMKEWSIIMMMTMMILMYDVDADDDDEDDDSDDAYLASRVVL